MDDETDEASAVYLRLKAASAGHGARPSRPRRARATDDESSVPFSPGREPKGLGDVVDDLTDALGWSASLAQSTVLDSWAAIVGEETAAHTTPAGISEGVLTVACDSTAWATQLRLMRSLILDRLAAEHPDAGISSIVFRGPGAPSWRKGPRSIPGRGPRDTYG